MYSWVSALLKGQGIWTKVRDSDGILRILSPLGVSAQDRFLLCRNLSLPHPPKHSFEREETFLQQELNAGRGRGGN